MTDRNCTGSENCEPTNNCSNCVACSYVNYFHPCDEGCCTEYQVGCSGENSYSREIYLTYYYFHYLPSINCDDNCECTCEDVEPCNECDICCNCYDEEMCYECGEHHEEFCQPCNECDICCQ